MLQFFNTVLPRAESSAAMLAVAWSHRRSSGSAISLVSGGSDGTPLSGQTPRPVAAGLSLLTPCRTYRLDRRLSFKTCNQTKILSLRNQTFVATQWCMCIVTFYHKCVYHDYVRAISISVYYREVCLFIFAKILDRGSESKMIKNMTFNG